MGRSRFQMLLSMYFVVGGIDVVFEEDFNVIVHPLLDILAAAGRYDANGAERDRA